MSTIEDYENYKAAYEGTSSLQYADPDKMVVTKAYPAVAPAVGPMALGQTNASSIFWAMQTINTNGIGSWTFTFRDPVVVNTLSQVAVSMTELDNNNTPFLGAASMQVWNVVPRPFNDVIVNFKVDFWDHPLRVRFNFIIVN